MSNNDFDGKPGDSDNSAEYGQRYDQEEGNNEAESTRELRKEQMEDRFARRMEDLDEGLEDNLNVGNHAQSVPKVGEFRVPASGEENNFAWHLQQVRQDPKLAFNPYDDEVFDKIIMEHAARPEIFDPANPEFSKYEPLRENLAVLGNYIKGYYMQDGTFDLGSDEEKITDIKEVAEFIGDGLRHDKSWVGRNFSKPLNTELMNIMGEGAAYAYREMLKIQRTPVVAAGVQRDFRRMAGMNHREWNLLPLKDSPFSNAGLDSLIVMYREALRHVMATHGAVPEPGKSLSDIAIPSGTLAGMGNIPVAKKDVSTLNSQEKSESVYHGKRILEFFKHLEFGDKGIEELAQNATADERAKVRAQIEEALQLYDNYTEEAFAKHPQLAQSAKAKEAEDAADALTHAVKLLATLEKNPGSVAAAQQILADQEEQLDSKEKQANHEAEQLAKERSLDRLMDSLEGGLEEAHYEMEAAEEAQEQAEEEAAEKATEAAMVQEYGKRRKKRRAVRGKSMAKIARDIRMDDYALGQGVHSRHETTSRSAEEQRGISLSNDKWELVKELGKKLAASGRESAELQAASDKKEKDNKLGGMDVNNDGKFDAADLGGPRPFDETVAQRTRQQLEQERNKRTGIT